MQPDQEFLEQLVKQLVNNPDQVSVDRIVDDRGVLLTLKVDPSDVGYVIGRQGSVAQAIRTLLRILGARSSTYINLKIEDPRSKEREKEREASSLNDDMDLKI